MPTVEVPSPAGPAQTPPDPASPSFHLFPFLPAEIRIQIWQASFLPRVLELHSFRAHYADKVSRAERTPPTFQSRSFNPAALAVCHEARSIALEVYDAALPLAPEKDQARDGRPGDLRLDDHHLLYIALDRDTLVLLGNQPAAKITKLVTWLRDYGRARHPCMKGRPLGMGEDGTNGLRRLCVDAGDFAHPLGAQMLRVLGRTLFTQLDMFGLLVFGETGVDNRIPPPWWRGGWCELREEFVPGGERHESFNRYTKFVVPFGGQFKDGDGWMVVGRNRMKIADLVFVNGW